MEKGLNTLKFIERMLDETTKDILKINDSNKKSIYSILRWMVQNYNELRKKDNMDLTNKRLRCNEYIVSLLTKAFNERMTLDTHNAMSSAIGWAVIHAMISDAIRYARGVDDSVASSVSEKDIRSAFTQSEVFLEAYPTLDKIIQTRAVENHLELDWRLS